MDETIPAHSLRQGKRRDARRRRALSRYRQAALANQSGVWEWDLVTGEHFRSPHILHILGLGPDQKHRLSEDLSDLLHPEDIEPLKGRVEAFLLGATDSFEAEFRLRHRDGSYRSLLSRASAIRDGEGQAQRLVGAYTDITAWRQAQETREAHLRTLGDNLPDSVIFRITASPDGKRRFLYVSGGIKRMAGITAESAMRDANLLYERIHPEDRDALTKTEAEALHSFEPFQFECRFRCADGIYRWHELRSVPHLLEDGTTVWDGLQTNIAIRKEAEAKLERRETEFRTLLDLLPQIAVVLTPSMQMTYANQRFYEYSGWPDEQTVPGAGWSQLIYPADIPTARAAAADLQSGNAYTQYELRFRRADGFYRWHLVRAEPILDMEGQVERWIATLTDIHDQKTAEAAADQRARTQARISELLQTSLLIRPAVRALPGLSLWWHYEAAALKEDTLVGGDFYDTIRLGPESVALVIGDVMGKGLAAALGTADVKLTLRAFLREDPDPVSALARLNTHLLARREWDDNPLPLQAPDDTLAAPVIARGPHAVLCVTAIVLNTTTGAGRIAVAGMEPPLHITATCEAASLVTGGLPLGVLPDWQPDGATDFLLAPGGMLALFTDGLTEARRRGGTASFDLLGHDRLLATIRAALAESNPPRIPPLNVLGKCIVAAAREFTGGTLSDDICLLLAARPI